MEHVQVLFLGRWYRICWNIASNEFKIRYRININFTLFFTPWCSVEREAFWNIIYFSLLIFVIAALKLMMLISGVVGCYIPGHSYFFLCFFFSPYDLWSAILPQSISSTLYDWFTQLQKLGKTKSIYATHPTREEQKEEQQNSVIIKIKFSLRQFLTRAFDRRY